MFSLWKLGLNLPKRCENLLTIYMYCILMSDWPGCIKQRYSWKYSIFEQIYLRGTDLNSILYVFIVYECCKYWCICVVTCVNKIQFWTSISRWLLFNVCPLSYHNLIHQYVNYVEYIKHLEIVYYELSIIFMYWLTCYLLEQVVLLKIIAGH